MECEQALFVAVRAKVAGDTGSSPAGLMNSTGQQFLLGNMAAADPINIGGAYRHGDPTVRDSGDAINLAHPCLVVSVEAMERSATPAAASPNKKLFDAVVHLFLFTDRDAYDTTASIGGGLGQLNAIQARLYSLFDNVSLTSITDTSLTPSIVWTFAPMGRVGRPRYFDTGKENRAVISYRVIVTRT